MCTGNAGVAIVEIQHRKNFAGPKIQTILQSFPKVIEIHFPKVDTRFPKVENISASPN